MDNKVLSLPTKQFNSKNINSINIDNGRPIRLTITEDIIEVCLEKVEDKNMIENLHIKIRKDIPLLKILFRNYKNDLVQIENFKNLPNDTIKVK